MKQLLTKIILTVMLLWAQADKAVAQHEFVVKIDPASGAINRFDSIPGVMYIAPHAVLDDKNKRFLFIGQPSDQSTNTLYSIDAVTGNMVSKALLPKSPTLNSMRYNNTSGILYGITVLSGNNALVSINPNTGVYTTIKAIPDMRSLAEEMIIDNNNQRILLNCLGTDGRFTLISLDMNGNLLSKPVIPNITGLQYDNSTNKLYALHYTGTQEELVQVDALSGALTTIGNVPADGVFQFSPTFDEVHHRYLFSTSSKGVGSLLSIDANTGAVLSNPMVPTYNVVDKDNVIQFRYSNSLNQLYALHWGATNTNTSPTNPTAPVPPVTETKIYYTPVGRSLIINKASTDCSARMALYTAQGQTVIADIAITNGSNEVHVPPMATGIYIVKLFCGNTLLRSTKLFIAH